MRLSPAASLVRRLGVALAFLGVFALAFAQEGEIRIAMQYDHGTFDPQLATSVTDKQMSTNLYDGLVQYEIGTTNIEPDLATDWELSEDGLQWTFDLRQGVQFHHGYGEFTSSDVVFTFERLLDPELGSPNAALMQSIEMVEAMGNYQVRFTLSEPDPAFLDKLANWFSYIVSEKAVAEKGSAFGDDPVGTARYRFESWTPQQQTVLSAFPESWVGTPGLARVVYVPIPDATTMYNAFEAGDVDMIQVTDPDKLARYEQDERLEVHTVPGLITRFFGMKSDEGPLAEPLVREAITYAIDRDAMMEFVFQGISTPADSILAPGVQHVKRNVVNYEYDPERARELLAEADYPNGFSVTYTVPNIDRFTLPATIIQDNLRSVGIQLQIEVMETQAFLADLRSDRGLAMFSLSRSQDATPDRVLYTWHHSGEIPGNNWSRIDIPEVDKWLDEAVTTLDEERRAELFGLVQERVAEGNYYYYIDHENMIFAVHDRVEGFVADPQRSIRLDDVRVGN
jgi:peptide/nickel transport system substrate-binding protein